MNDVAASVGLYFVLMVIAESPTFGPIAQVLAWGVALTVILRFLDALPGLAQQVTSFGGTPGPAAPAAAPIPAAAGGGGGPGAFTA